jgi:hypothetical protein
MISTSTPRPSRSAPSASSGSGACASADHATNGDSGSRPGLRAPVGVAVGLGLGRGRDTSPERTGRADDAPSARRTGPSLRAVGAASPLEGDDAGEHVCARCSEPFCIEHFAVGAAGAVYDLDAAPERDGLCLACAAAAAPGAEMR